MGPQLLQLSLKAASLSGDFAADFPEPGIHPGDFSARIGGSNLLVKDREFRAQESCCYLMQLI
jgi:hypothetical protein